MRFFSKLFGDENSRALRALQPLVERINALESEMQTLSDEQLRAKTDEFKKRLGVNETLDDLLPEAFATVREAAKRTTGMRHFDVQLLGGIILHGGAITEMRTGEGKTLVATLPVYLNALTGRGVHVVTVNDYLARRDAVWMGQVYAALGLSVGVVNSQNQAYRYDPGHKEEDTERDEKGAYKIVYDFLRPAKKHDAYAADITYGTNNEFGFDYLRDNTAYEKSQLSQREHAFAIVDEVDSILIDEARTPLIISMPSVESEDLYAQFAGIARSLTPESDYTIDEKRKAVQLTDAGIERAERALGIDNIYTDAGIKYVHHLETAVRAKALYQREKEYVVRDDEVIIVDEFTGRLQPGRRWSEGLHQAIEAKEGVRVQRESRTLASITYQNYFRQYDKLSGMTGTAATSAEEFFKVYGLETRTVPTNKTVERTDRDDFIFRTESGKYKAVARKVKALNEKGQPVLIGTVSIEKNEQLAEHLRREGVTTEVLNAKQHEREGEVIARAGTKGAVTIATNMAGRGVDIKLGGVEATAQEADEVRKLGGLFVLGTERHEARRIDNQLRGRAGRQGDPGETQFFVSLEDDLMRIFASDTVGNFMQRMNVPEDEPIQHRLISRSLETAQKKIEGLHFDARKHVLAFDDVMNTQRQTIYARRNRLLVGDADAVRAEIMSVIGDDTALAESVREKEEALGEESFITVVRRLLLQVIDTFWIEHLELMEYTRSSVNLRAYGQRDPLVEYKREGLRLFHELQEAIDEKSRELLPNIAVGSFERDAERLKRERERLQTIGGTSSASTPAAARPKKLGRNDIVTITNGTETKQIKYKKAEPLLEGGEWRLV